MNKLNKIFYLVPASVCIFNSHLYSFERHKEIEINSNLKLNIHLSGEAVRGGKINVKISALPSELKKLKNVNLNLSINRGIFRFIKKYFDSDIFKVKTEKLDDNIMILEFTLKNKKELSFSDNCEIELMNFDLNIKKKIEQNESDLIFNFNIENIEKEHSEHVSMSSKIINIESEELNINFDEDNKFYKVSVPNDKQYINLKISKLTDEIEEVEYKRIKLKKAGTNTLLKIENYEIEICRLEKEKSSKKEEKSAKKEKLEPKKKVKDTKITLKSPKKENKKKKNESSDKTKSKSYKKSKKTTKKDKIQEICDNNDKIELDQDFEVEDQNDAEVKEEKIENNKNSDKIKWSIGCAGLLLFLVLLLTKLRKKYKNKKNIEKK